MKNCYFIGFFKRWETLVYNIQGKETLTVKEIVTEIHRYFGKEVPDGCFGTVERADVGMKYLALNGKKLFNTIGYEARVSIVDVIETYNQLI